MTETMCHFEDGDFIVDAQDAIVITPEELLLEDLEGDILVTLVVLSVYFPAQVDLRGVALADRLDDLVLAVEDWMLPV